ncbi:uncharacterized protein LOC133921623 [Phragmites australis]|uniref:uncharacterized protein LOC133921623 n=1 Tax=Phragmites australis TaxID=29695 RepID=UPI002D778371|nr:uncharacterized protein LOC133921623 [Phragmites australis]
MAGATPIPAQTSHVSARARPIPPGLVPVAVLLAAAIGLLALLPSLAQAVWEVPHLFLLGLVISYGVFVHKSADADGNDNGAKEGSLAWNSRYHPEDALVVVTDHAAPSDDCQERARERPLSLPVRRLRPAAQESETGNASDGIGEETDSSASSSGFWAGARAAPSPPSVLDADLGLSPSSEPQSPPFFVHSTNKSRRSNAATPSTMSRGLQCYHHSMPGDQPLSDDGEVTDWDEEADGSDEMTVPSERSFRGDFSICANDGNDHSDGDSSADEELLKLATKAAAAEGEDEVDKKADEFIAKFREQIRLQKL